MTARDRFLELAMLARQYPQFRAAMYRESAQALDALDRAEADADRLAEAWDEFDTNRSSSLALAHMLTARRLHKEAVAQR